MNSKDRLEIHCCPDILSEMLNRWFDLTYLFKVASFQSFYIEEDRICFLIGDGGIYINHFHEL